jgi:hypothetical protein
LAFHEGVSSSAPKRRSGIEKGSGLSQTICLRASDLFSGGPVQRATGIKIGKRFNTPNDGMGEMISQTSGYSTSQAATIAYNSTAGLIQTMTDANGNGTVYAYAGFLLVSQIRCNALNQEESSQDFSYTDKPAATISTMEEVPPSPRFLRNNASPPRSRLQPRDAAPPDRARPCPRRSAARCGSVASPC